MQKQSTDPYHFLLMGEGIKRRTVHACRNLIFTALLLGLSGPAAAESGYDAWLRYAAIEDRVVRQRYDMMPAVVIALGNSAVIRAAQEEVQRGVRGMLGRTLRTAAIDPEEDAIILGTYGSIARILPTFSIPSDLKEDGFVLKSVKVVGKSHIVVTSPGERGVLYGAFALLREIGLRRPVSALNLKENPHAPLRTLNHWDNLDGSIERGYAGPSIFFERDNLTKDLGRARDYARMMASLGINGCSINNVNANTRVITAEFLPQLARVGEVFRTWGVRLFIAIDFSSPRKIGGLDTFDPLDPRVAAWWKGKVEEIYSAVPDLGGFVLKADSEGRLGPSAYGRSHADAANVVAGALKPHGGILFYRGFVYDHHMDWRNLKNDRAAAAYENFKRLDGQFENNVVLQIKHGPIDFQVREPASPLFSALEKTNQAIELQVTQEYTGQQRHLCFLVPMWKEVLDFDMHARANGTLVRDLVAGNTFDRPLGGFVGVSNAGSDPSWLGHQLAAANLYGFGRLAWDPSLTSRQIADEWTRLTFDNDPDVVRSIVQMLLGSWETYEKYTGPLGAGTLTDIIGVHYGPAVESSERNGWGQWHRADDKGIGMDRTVATGTGFIGQYPTPVAKKYESIASCQDALLLFMHHVPYTHILHSGKTVIQHVYDTHYEGAAEAEKQVATWRSLKGKIDEARFTEVLNRLEYQAGHAEVWRDAVCNWFLRASGIPDSKSRAGNFPNRWEGEAMKLEGYKTVEVHPWEAASGGKAVECRNQEKGCAASLRFEGKAAWYDLKIRYFDQNNGVSRFKLFVVDRLIAEWAADDLLPTNGVNSHSSTRRIVRGQALRPGDEIRIEGFPQGGERATLDYLEVAPAKR